MINPSRSKTQAYFSNHPHTQHLAIYFSNKEKLSKSHTHTHTHTHARTSPFMRYRLYIMQTSHNHDHAHHTYITDTKRSNSNWHKKGLLSSSMFEQTIQYWDRSPCVSTILTKRFVRRRPILAVKFLFPHCTSLCYKLCKWSDHFLVPSGQYTTQI